MKKDTQIPHILLVEDSPAEALLLRDFLSEEDWRLSCVTRGEEVLQMLLKDSVDLILLDIVLPDMTGFEVCKTLKANPNYAHIPIVFITGVSDEENLSHAFSYGAADYIMKPVRKLELLARLGVQLKLLRTKRKYLESQNKLQAILELAPDAIITINKEGKVLSFNEAAQKIFQYSAEEMIGQSIKLLMPEPYHSEHRLYLENYLKTGYSKIIGAGREVIGYRKDRVEIPLYISISEVQYGDEIIFVGILQDITDRKKFEEELIIAKKQAEDANSAKSEFLANMSHEIRTPMNAIIGFSEILASKIKEPALQKNLANIIYSGNTLLGLINDILDLSKIEARKLELQISETDIYELGEELRGIFVSEIEKKKLHFTVSIQEGIPRKFLLDKLRVKQILLNLIGNAIKFTHTGFVKLVVGAEKVMDRESMYNLVLAVEDSGIGIPAEQFEVIFEAFSQKVGQNHAKYGGTGLGLTISQKLIQIMGGIMEVDSREGRGATFTAHIPNVMVYSQAVTGNIALETESERIFFPNAKILLVHNKGSELDLVQDYLADSETNIYEAATFQEILETCKLVFPNLVLLDCDLLEEEVEQLSYKIKDLPGMQDVKIVFLTKSLTVLEKKKLLQVGHSIITKPLRRTVFLQELMCYLPYTLSKQAGSSIDEKFLLQWKQIDTDKKIRLRTELQATIKDRKTQLYGIINLEDLKHLAVELKVISVEFEVEYLEYLAKDFLAKLQSFDVELIRTALVLYIRFVENLDTIE
ncbi:MAG: response regulator [Spirochaetota bacterium]